MAKKRASDATVLAFIAAVFPEAPELARLAFDEEHVLKTATEKLLSGKAAGIAEERARATRDLKHQAAEVREVLRCQAPHPYRADMDVQCFDYPKQVRAMLESYAELLAQIARADAVSSGPEETR